MPEPMKCNTFQASQAASFTVRGCLLQLAFADAAMTVSMEKARSASVTDMVPMAEERRPENGTCRTNQARSQTQPRFSGQWWRYARGGDCQSRSRARTTSGERPHCALMLIRPTTLESASTRLRAHPPGSRHVKNTEQSLQKGGGQGCVGHNKDGRQ
eukprot:6172939-Pleurochrysis_carterae.AAC.1